jgi:hypothetical protein
MHAKESLPWFHFSLQWCLVQTGQELLVALVVELVSQFLMVLLESSGLNKTKKSSYD